MTIVVVQAVGLVTVQDLGRAGHMHEGLAHGGALVRGMLVAANRAVGNPDHTPALEVLGRLVVRAEVDVETSAGPLAHGATLAIESEPQRVAYLALRGGIAAPPVLGGRATQLSAGLGARVSIGARFAGANEPRMWGPVVAPARGGAIRVIAGPDADAFGPDAIVRLCAAMYRVLPTSDRVGTRLEGPTLPRRDGAERSRPMVRGAIEVPRDGMPIVLGPEHPTIGGYPIVGVIADADQDRFFAVRVGGDVQFEVGHASTSRSSST